jgi:esterase/lipase superfamily enzyme
MGRLFYELGIERCYFEMGIEYILEKGIVGALAMTVMLVGCAGDFQMMPTPVVYRIANADTFKGFRSLEETTDIDVFYVTDRKPVNGADGEEGYTDERGLSLRMGRAVVEMGGEGRGVAGVGAAVNSIQEAAEDAPGEC